MQSMSLAPGDYLFTGNTSCPVTFAFAYPTVLDPAALQRGLDALQTHIPWLAGRLRASTGASYVFDLDERARLSLEVAHSNQPFSELYAGEPLVRLVKAHDGEPLVAARITQTPQGSIVALSMSHALVDGFSLFQVMSMWAACTRGEPISAPPTDRLLSVSNARRAAERELSPKSLLEQCGLFWKTRRTEPVRLPKHERVHVSAAKIDALMQEAQRDVSTKLRQNDVLTAWLWRTYGRQWWAEQGNPFVYATCPVDVRRLLGEANQALFACAICFATARASFDELSDAPLGELALRIQRSVADVFAGKLEDRFGPLEALRRQHGLRGLESVHLRHPRRGMLMTNMSRLPLVQLDFGSGAPNDLKVYSEIDSMAAVLPARDGVAIDVVRPFTRARPSKASDALSARAG